MRGDYAESRVPEYWMVNAQTETITVLRKSKPLFGIAFKMTGPWLQHGSKRPRARA
jgi:Uma2 family endonuclease